MNDQTLIPPSPSPDEPGGPDGPPAVIAEVLHDGRVSADDEQLILAALAGCGVAAQVKIIPPRRDAQTLTWLVLISLPLQGFLSMVGEDAYSRFTHALKRLFSHHRKQADTPGSGDPPVLLLQDPATGLRIVLEPDLPREAHEQLFTLDMSRYRYGPLHYDRTLHHWRSELDEADSGHTRS